MRSCTEVFAEEGPCIRSREEQGNAGLVQISLAIFFHLIGATPEICKRQSPCDAPECFEMRGPPEPACTSTSQTHLCRIDGICIEYNCDTDLSCKCNGRPFELADLTKCPVKDEETVDGAVLVALGVGAIAYCVWKACRKQRHGGSQLGRTEPQRQPLAEDQNKTELEGMNNAKKRNMLIFCLLLLISFQHIGAEAVYCIKELPCNITKCFKIRDLENAVSLVCSSIQQTEHCSISRTHIKLKCDVQLQCFCNEEGPFELDDFPEIPVKDQSISMENEVHPERNNTNRTESSGSSMTPLQIAFAVVGAVLAVGAITCCVWKACRRQGHSDTGQEERDPRKQRLAEDQNEKELEDMNGDGERVVV